MNDGTVQSSDAVELVARKAVDVVLSSDFDLTSQFVGGFARELYVGTGGTVVAKMVGDAAAHTYKNVPNGGFLHGYFTSVSSTSNGTTASDIVARR